MSDAEANRCLKGDACKLRTCDGGADSSDADTHACVTCGGAMHAICGNEASGVEEG